uniref:Uncharacterized protein n=2 Tax=Plectus sambesii TaxID=2011161 RepID=A0A914WRC6_9BILA
MAEESGACAAAAAVEVSNGTTNGSPSKSDAVKRALATLDTIKETSHSPSPSGRSYTLFSATNPDINSYRREMSPSTHSVSRPPKYTPMFKKIDFDDMVDDAIRDRKPAWKQWQESIEDSYHKAKRTVERSRSEIEVQSAASGSGRRRFKKETSPFSHLDSESLTLRKPSWFASGAMQPRGYTPSLETGPYAAPAVHRSQGIESEFSSRYDKAASEVEQRLLKNSILPAHMKIATAKEFRAGPAPAPGSYSEALADETDYATYLPRPYYSRPNREDPDYFDYDLGHSVSLYKKPEGRYVPRGPQSWENKLMAEVKAKGSTPVSGYLFTKGDNDYRTNNSSLLSAALRTPSFWEQRFTSIGKEVRDSQPVSMDSINRNRPVPNRFTEYRDPDFEDLSDCDSD